jgi:hypothetical protein
MSSSTSLAAEVGELHLLAVGTDDGEVRREVAGLEARARAAGAEVGTVSVPWAVRTAGRKATQAARSRGMFFMERETN